MDVHVHLLHRMLFSVRKNANYDKKKAIGGIVFHFHL